MIGSDTQKVFHCHEGIDDPFRGQLHSMTDDFIPQPLKKDSLIPHGTTSFRTYMNASMRDLHSFCTISAQGDRLFRLIPLYARLSMMHPLDLGHPRPCHCPNEASRTEDTRTPDREDWSGSYPRHRTRSRTLRDGVRSWHRPS